MVMYTFNDTVVAKIVAHQFWQLKLPSLAADIVGTVPKVPEQPLIDPTATPHR